MIIYKITNRLNGKVYVGQTIMPIARRWSQHSTSKKISPLYNAFRKNGLDNFTLEVLCSALSPEHLNFLEVQFINQFDCIAPKGYNLTSGGDSAFSRSEETKMKQSLSMQGHEVSAETREKISTALMGRPGVRKGASHTLEAKARISQGQLGRKHSNETKSKMRAAKLGTKTYNARTVVCVETGLVYNSTADAARALGLVQSSVSAVCNGKRKSTGGRTFRYL